MRTYHRHYPGPPERCSLRSLLFRTSVFDLLRRSRQAHWAFRGLLGVQFSLWSARSLIRPGEPSASRASTGRSLCRVASTASGWNVSCRVGFLPPTGSRCPFHGTPERVPSKRSGRAKFHLGLAPATVCDKSGRHSGRGRRQNLNKVNLPRGVNMKTASEEVTGMIFVSKWSSQTLCAGAELGVFDFLSRDRMRTASEVAAETGLDPALLYRLLR